MNSIQSEILFKKPWNIVFMEIRPVVRKVIFKHVFGVDNSTLNDIEQEIFIKIYKKLHLYNKNFSFYSWVYVLSFNHVLDFLRKKKRMKNKEEDSSFIGIEKNSSNSRISIHQILNSIPLEYRALLIKKYVQGFSQQEIATEMNLPIGTIGGKIQKGVRLARALCMREGLALSDFIGE